MLRYHQCTTIYCPVPYLQVYRKSYKEFTDLRLVQQLAGHQGVVWTLKFSRNGKYLASGVWCVGGSRARVWVCVLVVCVGEWSAAAAMEGSWPQMRGARSWWCVCGEVHGGGGGGAEGVVCMRVRWRACCGRSQQPVPACLVHHAPCPPALPAAGQDCIIRVWEVCPGRGTGSAPGTPSESEVPLDDSAPGGGPGGAGGGALFAGGPDSSGLLADPSVAAFQQRPYRCVCCGKCVCCVRAVSGALQRGWLAGLGPPLAGQPASRFQPCALLQLCGAAAPLTWHAALLTWRHAARHGTAGCTAATSRTCWTCAGPRRRWVGVSE